jgi:glycogen(starch) synthase
MAQSSPPRKRLLLLAYAFAPGTGGIETVSRLLAESLAERHYDVRVLTATPSHSTVDANPSPHYQIIRAPSTLELYRQLRWSDVVLQSNISLKLAWPLAFCAFPRPWIVVHHTSIARPDGKLHFRDQVKLWSLRHAQCYSVSNYLASTIPVASQVLFNPYDDALFQPLAGALRHRPLIFLGRLVPAKGVDILIAALNLLRTQSFTPSLTVVGDGPEEQNLRKSVTSLGLGEQVSFVGRKHGPELVRLLNEHQVLVVPSRPAPPEAFGIVSVEAIACGCVVIAANQGGLPESIGPCGVTFKSEFAPDLALKIRQVLESPERMAELRLHRDTFLRSFARRTVVDRYVSAIRDAVELRLGR